MRKRKGQRLRPRHNRGEAALLLVPMVLGDIGKAKNAYDAAKVQFKDNAQAIAALAGLAKEMNIP